MKYVFICYDGYPLTIAHHLAMEGNEVIVGVIDSFLKLGIPGSVDDEKPYEKKERLSLFNGILHKNPYTEVIKFLRSVPKNERDDYFVFFDFNNMYKISELVMKMGYKNGLFPTEWYYKMEKEREMAKDFVRKHYPDIEVADSHDFKKVDDGIKFLEESEGKVYVLKSNGNAGKTIVPQTDDEELGKKLIIKALQEYKSDYENGGFLLEEKIKNCLEVTPVMVFYNGEPVYSLVEFENKEFGAGNIGIQKGGNQALSVKTEFDSKINQISFPPIVFELASKQPGMSVYDIGLLFDGEKFYFTEFCAMRFGWDGIFSEIVMRDDGQPFVGNYFEDVKEGKNPLVNNFGASVRLFNLNGAGEKISPSEEDVAVEINEKHRDNLFLYQVKKKNGEIVTCGNYDMLGVATGASNDMETAVAKAYEVVGSVTTEKLYYRPKFDFLSEDYNSSIPNRYEAIKPFLRVNDEDTD